MIDLTERVLSTLIDFVERGMREGGWGGVGGGLKRGNLPEDRRWWEGSVRLSAGKTTKAEMGTDHSHLGVAVHPH